MKKIFIALLLCATSVVTWADVTYNFGTGSTWTVKCTDSNVESATGVVINVAKAGDLAALRSANEVYDNNGNPVDYNNKPEDKYNQKKQVFKKDVVVSGNLSEADMNCIYGGATYQWSFCTAKTLDLSGVNTTATSIFDDIVSGWASFAYCHNNGSTAGLVIPSSGNTGGSASTDPSEPTEPTNPTSSIYEVPSDAKQHITVYSTYNTNDVCEIHPCKGNCPHSLTFILNKAGITPDVQFDLVKIKLDNEKNEVTRSLSKINTYTLDLSEVTNLDSWADVKNQYARNVILPATVEPLNKNVKDNFNSALLNNVIVAKKGTEQNSNNIAIDAYINKPGLLANGLQYVSLLNPSFNGNAAWYNKDNRHNDRGYGYDPKNISELRISGCVFARDLKSTWSYNLTKEGHIRPVEKPITYQDGYAYYPGGCSSTLAPSLSDPNVIYFDPVQTGKNEIDDFNNGALLGAHITHYDFTHAEFGEYVDGVFKYYPADMTLSELQYLGNDPSVESIYLPKSPTQYIIPEGFIHDSKHIHDLCIPCNYTEIHRFAFLSAANNANTGDGGGINHYTTTAAEDGEQLGILKGEVIDNGAKTMTLASTMKFVGRGAFSGYGGAAHIEDVYVLAKHAPICEFYAFDQKTYVGQDSHKQEHLIRKGNYVNPGNGMAMLHFPNTLKDDGSLDQKEMLNYSDMTRKYRLYDETGKYDNVGNILVWPTQAQYNRSFNQALAGVTWWAWKENLDDSDNPDQAFAGSDNVTENCWLAGSGDENANHEAIFSMAAKYEGFSDKFIEEFDNRNPHDFFDGSEGKGSFDGEESSAMQTWDGYMLAKANANSDSDRPLTYDFRLYGGWHQFTIAELYDFMLEKPGPDPDRKDYYNFSRYNKNIWYSVCFPFNLTKSQLQKALGDPENGKYPYVSTLAGVNRDPKKLDITIHMSKNLLYNKIVYDKNCPYTVKCDKSTGYAATYEPVEYGDDDIVIEANIPYFIKVALPEEEIIKAEKQGDLYFRKSEISALKQKDDAGREAVVFPMPTHVHAVNGAFSAYINGQDEEVKDTTYSYNYYFVGNYIPQTMPENAYYLSEYKKSNGTWGSSFYRNSPKKAGKMWLDNESIVVALVEDNTSGHSNSKGRLFADEEKYDESAHNYVWNAQPHDDWLFFNDTDHETYAKSAFGMQIENNYTTRIQFADDYEIPQSDKVYNLNGQFVGTTYNNNMAKGIYIVGGKKVVVK